MDDGSVRSGREGNPGRLGRAEGLSNWIIGFKSLQMAADQVLAEVEDEFFQDRLVDDLTKIVQRELDA